MATTDATIDVGTTAIMGGWELKGDINYITGYM